MDFKAGDVVTLKSSRLHKMTVNRLNAISGEVECIWPDGKEIKRAWFNPAALQHYVKQEVPTRTVTGRSRRIG